MTRGIWKRCLPIEERESGRLSMASRLDLAMTEAGMEKTEQERDVCVCVCLWG